MPNVIYLSVGADAFRTAPLRRTGLKDARLEWTNVIIQI